MSVEAPRGCHRAGGMAAFAALLLGGMTSPATPADSDPWPAAMFPCRVELRQPVEFFSQVGRAVFPPGREVWALAVEDGLVTLTTGAGAGAAAAEGPRATVPVAEVNLDEVREQWLHARRQAQLRREQIAREEERIRRLREQQEWQLALARHGPPPARLEDGSYPALLRSIESGAVISIRLDEIKEWGEAMPAVIDDQAGWLVSLRYMTYTGIKYMLTEGSAFVVDGTVLSWQYTGSQEPIP